MLDIALVKQRLVTDEVYAVYVCVLDIALAKQRLVTDETTESDVDSDADDSMSFDSSPFASPRQQRNQALISSMSAVELATMADDDSNGLLMCLVTVFRWFSAFQAVVGLYYTLNIERNFSVLRRYFMS